MSSSHVRPLIPDLPVTSVPPRPPTFDLPNVAAAAGASVSSEGTPPLSSNQSNSQAKARRAFKACKHCRERKAKCDLGPDLDSPHEPPCTRCRREGVECTFLPSRRGGRVPFAAQKRKLEDEQDGLRPPAKRATSSNDVAKPQPSNQPLYPPSVPARGASDESQPAYLQGSAMGHVGSLASVTANQHYDFGVAPRFSSDEIGRSTLRYTASHPVPPPPPPISASDIFRRPRGPEPNQAPSDGSPESFSAHSEGSAQQHQATRKRRRRNSGPVDPETLAAATLRNPTDALDLLVLAADGGAVVDEATTSENSQDDPELDRSGGPSTLPGPTHNPHEPDKRSPASNGRRDESKRRQIAPPSLEDFPLVKYGVLSTKKLHELVDMFFSRMHFIFPICPHNRIPRDESQMAAFARDELYLTTVFVVIASRHDRDPKIHTESWTYMQTLISDIILGKAASVGAVEALLLLSEWLPRQPELAPAQINAEENRMSWMLVGTAVRLGYMLRLDEKSLQPAKPLVESTDNTEAQELLNRERVAWTYCYLFDRQISVRTGKAFWSRGPSLCFSGGGGGVYPTAAINFPSLRFIPETQDDYASLIQAYVELTQITTAVNDILYPSRDRTLALIMGGVYYKFLSDFERSLEAFRVTWEGKRFATYPLTECVWISFHYLRLHIFAFSFQAHVQRAQAASSPDDREEPPARKVIFPNGLAGSPDAKFIIDAIDAAADLLRLVTDRLHPGGAVPFLPSRFFMMFSYSAVFLLKAVYVEAVAPTDRTVIVRLLKRLIFVLACSSTDEQHPGVRYARLLGGLLRAFSQGHDSITVTRAATPSRRNSMDGGDVKEGATTSRPDFDLALASWTRPSNGLSATPSSLHASNGADMYPAFAPTPGPSSAFPANPSTPFPLLPFSESQPFHQLASILDDRALDFDLGAFDNPVLPAAPAEAFNFLLDDQQWGSFDLAQAGGDWSLGGL